MSPSSFIGEGGNALIIGKPGTGKSHVAKAVAYQATLQAFDVRYVEADSEFACHALGSTAEQAALLRSFVEPNLVVLDDLLLARRIAEASAELLQTASTTATSSAAASSSPRTAWRRTGVSTSATPPWPPPSSIT